MGYSTAVYGHVWTTTVINRTACKLDVTMLRRSRCKKKLHVSILR